MRRWKQLIEKSFSALILKMAGKLSWLQKWEIGPKNKLRWAVGKAGNPEKIRFTGVTTNGLTWKKQQDLDKASFAPEGEERIISKKAQTLTPYFPRRSISCCTTPGSAKVLVSPRPSSSLHQSLIDKRPLPMMHQASQQFQQTLNCLSVSRSSGLESTPEFSRKETS